MSDRVTWGVCPRCGRQAAIGWVIISQRGAQPVREVAVEIDCLGHCELDGPALAQAVLHPVKPSGPNRAA